MNKLLHSPLLELFEQLSYGKAIESITLTYLMKWGLFKWLQRDRKDHYLQNDGEMIHFGAMHDLTKTKHFGKYFLTGKEHLCQASKTNVSKYSVTKSIHQCMFITCSKCILLKHEEKISF